MVYLCLLFVFCISHASIPHPYSSQGDNMAVCNVQQTDYFICEGLQNARWRSRGVRYCLVRVHVHM